MVSGTIWKKHARVSFSKYPYYYLLVTCMKTDITEANSIFLVTCMYETNRNKSFTHSFEYRFSTAKSQNSVKSKCHLFWRLP